MQFGNPLAQAGQYIAYGPTSSATSGGQATAQVSVPEGTRTLILSLLPSSFPSFPEITGVQVIGNQSGFAYLGGQNPEGTGGARPPYLYSQAGAALCIVPVNAVVDSSYTVNVINSVAAISITAWSDPEQYDQSIYYNGQLSTAESGATGTILNGPARLLTISCQAGSAVLVDGQVMLNAAAGTAGAFLAFPPDTILEAGVSVGVINQGACTWAYP